MKYTLDYQKYAELARRVAAEGSVLLRNEEDTLPLRRGQRVSVFGRTQFEHYKSGTGSGGMVNAPYVTNIIDSLKEDGTIQVNEALEAMGLTELKDEYPRLLSFGQKRRLGVAAALALNPRTLILDEITNGQDALEKEAMMSYLQAINEKRGITIVLISHDMDIVRRYAKRAIVLHYGKLVYDGTPAKLFDGSQPVERWGLCRPTVAALAASLGMEAATAEEFCKQVICKEGSR